VEVVVVVMTMMMIISYVLQNVAVEWLTLLLRILEVPVSSLGVEANYADRIFAVFLSLQATAGIVFLLQIRPRPLSSVTLSVLYLLFV
jgi:hypothetical protein